MKVLFFSRGRGYGHAVPDMAISRELQNRISGLKIRFVSYAAGAHILRKNAEDVIDLKLPEANSFIATLVRSSDVIARERPSCIIAHEEFAALPAAMMRGLPSAFLSAWLPANGTIGAEALLYTQAIIVLGQPGIFRVPA